MGMITFWKRFIFSVGIIAVLITENAISFHSVLEHFDCPHGYLKEDGQCLMTTTETPEDFCQHGDVTGIGCAAKYQALPSCPPSYAFDEKYPSKHKKRSRCRKSITAPPVPYCNPGEILTGTTCTKLRIIDPVCPVGTKELGDHCVKYRASKKKCPYGYREMVLGGKKNPLPCVKENKVPAFQTCPDDYQLVGHTCRKTIMVPPKCPSGTVPVGDACATYSPVSYKCPEGFQSSNYGHKGKECFRTETIDPSPCCSHDWVLMGDQCVRTITVSPKCPPGTKDMGQRCARYSRPQIICPDGATLKKKHGKEVCIIESCAEAIPTCPAEYTLENEICVKYIHRPQICPPGCNTVHGGCAISRKPDIDCPPDYTLRPDHSGGFGMTCSKPVVVEPMVKCDGGYILSDNGKMCEMTKSCPATAVCRKGVRDGDDCVEFSNVPPQYVCPDGYTHVGKKRCEKQEQYDCSSLEYEEVCQKIAPCEGKECLLPEYRRLHQKSEDKFRHGKHSVSKGHHDHSGHYHKGGPGPYYSADKKVVCEKVAIRKQKICSKTIYADAMIYCPEGTETSATGGCWTVHNIPPAYVCAEGELDEFRNCVQITRKVPNYSCPSGFELTSGHHNRKRCTATDIIAPDIHCDADEILENGMCVKYIEKVCPQGGCEIKVTKPIIPICPEGHTMSHSKKGVRCKMVECIEPVAICNVGALHEHERKCIEYLPKECPVTNCEISSTKNVKYVCPDGYSMGKTNRHTLGKHDGRPICQRKVFACHIPTCYGENTLEGDRCVRFTTKTCGHDNCEVVKTVPAKYMCPESYMQERFVHDRHECISREFCDYEYCCHRGELTENRMCATYVPKICPKKRCVVTQTSAASLSCPAGFEKSGRDLCVKVEQTDPIFTCSKGEDYQDGVCLATFKKSKRCKSGHAYLDHDRCISRKFARPIPKDYFRR